MPFVQFLHKPKNELEKGGRTPKAKVHLAEESEFSKKCPSCGKSTPLSILWDNFNICQCGHHYRLSARQRISLLADGESFSELFRELVGQDVLKFPHYEKKLVSVQKSSGENEAVICGEAMIWKKPCALFIMEPYFMMGSMGTAVGEKITRLFEYATEKNLPVVGYTVSGGARMQEGLLSLMQMAKTSGAVKRHSDNGGLYITMLTDPTTGGVTASFAMEGDIILAEPGATIGFAGARVIEQTVHKKLPKDFQKAEFLLQHGFIDAIVPRRRQRAVIGKLLQMHTGGMKE
ncbi:acetyl-CoA carboxylase, carboxyltransferase subunit beta [Parasporobacterium paucivorans]|uniref:Acetyl-coenzyme A carboxylase carboxyl transferase subunit beta n=1 Tax=Parasporobacterium paucivorans DSM 15970 TaxID=1122934 RepID=A0A1M6KCN8_9FIRM|nr:acetyl-CoA carboxylase, carboxyltransferase subunit beta [Parasporobacterium paucivorans]SHJ56710.1 acetyl-CoA carboxylase carboxyltransferase subunit alpha [Parasporobacterium paucivorans DSM 15970]